MHETPCADFIASLFSICIVNFLLIALVIFTVVRALNSFHRKNDKPIEEPAPEEPSEEVLLLREIRDMLAKDHILRVARRNGLL